MTDARDGHEHGERRAALEGIVVVDCTQVVAGPYCTRILADLGADVIKVEKPDGGDEVRKGGIMQQGGDSPQFHAANRNKRSVAIDLKDLRGRDLFLQLIDRADVLVESFRPGTMERLGIGYDVLRIRKPDLIFCSISGFGQTGPYRERGGFDLVAQGMSGLMSMTGIKGAPPVKVGVPMCDLSAGMFGAIGILAAIVNRDRGGEGQSVDTSLLEAGISFTFTESAYLWAAGMIAEPNGSAHRTRTPYQAVASADGWVVVASGTDATWDRLCDALERPDLHADERFATNRSRVENAAALIEAMESTMRRETTAYWVDRLNQFGCPAGPIYNIDQVYEDPHVQAREMEVVVDHPTAGPIHQIGFPVKFSSTPAQIRTAAPLLGQHTAEIVEGLLGIDSDTFGRLADAGVVRTADAALATPGPPALREPGPVSS
jgi:formyl-CoA transferase